MVWATIPSTAAERGNGVSWSLWVKVVDGEVVETTKSGDIPHEFFASINGHSGDHNNFGFSISLPAKDSPNPEAKEVKPE